MGTGTYDPYAAAEDAEVRRGPFRVFGQCMVDAWPCVLVKGSRPIAYDEGQHSPDQRRTRIVLTIYPLASSPLKNSIERGLIAESKEWTEVVRPSLRTIKTELRALHKSWVQVEMTPTREYTKSDGTTAQATVPTFIAIYPDEGTCEAAAAATFRPRDGGDGEAATATNGTANGAKSAPPKPAASADQEMNREAARKFLAAIWAASQNDPIKFDERLRNTPHVRDYFTIESPEVIEVMKTF